MESSSQSIKPLIKRSLHVGCNTYEDVEISNLKEAQNDAWKLHDLCSLKENDFDSVVIMTDHRTSLEIFYTELIKYLDHLIIQSQGTAKMNSPQYTFNFITFSCHGVMCENQTFAVIPFFNKETNAFEKQYININALAKKLAAVQNTYNIILFDGCRDVIKKEDLLQSYLGYIKTFLVNSTMKERSNANLAKAVENYQSTYHGHTLVIYSTKENTLSNEDEEKGGCGTNTFIDKVKANIEKGNKSWEFTDSYGGTFKERFTESSDDEWKKIIMFTHYPIKDQPQDQHEEVKSGLNVASMKPLDNDKEVLKILNDQMNDLLKQLQEKWFFQSQSSLIIGFLNNLVSKITFADPNDEVYFKAYVDSIPGKLKYQNYLTLIDEAFDWIFKHMDKAKGFKKIYSKPSEIKMTEEFNDKGDSLNMSSSQLLQKYPEIILDKDQIVGTYKYKSNDNFTRVLMQSAGTNLIFAGGANRKLQKFNAQFELIKTQNLEDELFVGVAVGSKLYCQMGRDNNCIIVFDQETMEKTDVVVQIQADATKIFQIDNDYLLIGQEDLYLCIVQVSISKSIFEHKFQSQKKELQSEFTMNVNDIATTYAKNEYAIATDIGIMILILNIDDYKRSGDRAGIFNFEETYLNSHQVEVIASSNPTQLVAGIRNIQSLYVISRTSKQVIQVIQKFEGRYMSLMPVMDYQSQHFPYFLVKDRSCVAMINTVTFEYVKIMTCVYDEHGGNTGLIQYRSEGEDDNQLIRVIVSSNTLDEKSIQEFVISK